MDVLQGVAVWGELPVAERESQARGRRADVRGEGAEQHGGEAEREGH